MRVAPIYMPTNNPLVPPFSTHPQQHLFSFDTGTPDGCEALSHCGLEFYFPNN